MTRAPSEPGRRPPGRNVTADRAIEILLLFNERCTSLSAAEVAARLAMSRSTTYRYLQSLRTLGFLEEEDGGGRYRLGPQILRLASVARHGLGLSEAALPVMRELARLTGESVLLTRRSGTQVVCIERENGVHLVRLSYERGQLLPVHAGASALIVLAFATAPEIDEVLANAMPLEPFTEHTQTDPDALREQLSQIAEQGYATSYGELDPGVRGIAAPVFWPDGSIAAGLSVVGLAYRMTDDLVPGLVAAVRKGAQAITSRLAELD